MTEVRRRLAECYCVVTEGLGPLLAERPDLVPRLENIIYREVAHLRLKLADSDRDVDYRSGCLLRIDALVDRVDELLDFGRGLLGLDSGIYDGSNEQADAEPLLRSQSSESGSLPVDQAEAVCYLGQPRELTELECHLGQYGSGETAPEVDSVDGQCRLHDRRRKLSEPADQRSQAIADIEEDVRDPGVNLDQVVKCQEEVTEEDAELVDEADAVLHQGIGRLLVLHPDIDLRSTIDEHVTDLVSST